MNRDDHIRLTFTGDLLCYAIQNHVSMDSFGNYEYDEIFHHISGYFSNSDIVCGSLETPLTDKNKDLTSSSKNFNTPDAFAKAAKNAGFNILTTGNNHALDRGLNGLDTTIKILDKYGIDHTGTYLSLQESENILIKNIKGLRIAFLSYTYGTNSRSNKHLLSESTLFKVDLLRKQDEPIIKSTSLIQKCIHKIRTIFKQHTTTKALTPILDSVHESEISNPANQLYINRLLQKIKKAKQNADIVVFCMHSGGQFNFFEGVGQYTNYIVNLVLKNGVDIIIGNHTHCVMPSKYDGKTFTSFALGNFCFTPKDGYYIDKVYADYSIIVHININIKTKAIDFISFSVCKSIRDEQDYSRVFCVADLYKQTLDLDKKKQLASDVTMVISHFINKDLTNVPIKNEYLYSEF